MDRIKSLKELSLTVFRLSKPKLYRAGYYSANRNRRVRELLTLDELKRLFGSFGQKHASKSSCIEFELNGFYYILCDNYYH